MRREYIEVLNLRQRLGFALMILAAILSVVYYKILPEIQRKLLFIDPIAYGDGSVEYIVRTKSFVGRGKVENEYYEDWVLRIPNSVQCLEADRNGFCSDYLPEKLVSDFGDGPIPTLNLYLKLPNLEPLKDRFIRTSPNVLNIYFGVGSFNIYGTDTGVFKPGGGGFANTHKIQTEIKCRKDQEIAPNLFRLRDATLTEKKAYGNKYKNMWDDKCISSRFSKRSEYALYGEADKRIGYGGCNFDPQKTNEFTKSHSCSFFIWLEQERRVQYSFHASHLKNLPEIYKKTVKFLNEATILEKSTNLRWRPSDND